MYVILREFEKVVLEMVWVTRFASKKKETFGHVSMRLFSNPDYQQSCHVMDYSSYMDLEDILEEEEEEYVSRRPGEGPGTFFSTTI